MDDPAADVCSKTPPPVFQPDSPEALRPPSFESFMMNAPKPSSMNPEDQLLNDEIQEITAEEYKQNLIEAQIDASQLAMEFKYQSTGAIPAEQLIQIKLVSPEGASQLEGSLKQKGKSNSESSKTQAKKMQKNLNRVNILKIIKTPDAPPITRSQSQIPLRVYSPVSLNNNRSNTVPPESQCFPPDPPITNNSNCSIQDSVFSDSSLNLSENLRNTINNAKSVLSIMENTTQDINTLNSNSKAFSVPQYSTYDPVSNTISPREIISPSVISKNSTPNFNGGTSPNVDLVSAQALTSEIIRCLKTLYKSFSFFQTGRASQAKYLEAWKSITKFVTRHATNLPPTTNRLENFAFNPGTCLYETLLKNIVDLGKEILKPSSTEPWFKPEIIDFDLLESFNNHENTLQPKDYISITAKSSHPETNLVRFLYSLRFTSQLSIQSWARIVAASIETVADELHQPAVPKAHQPVSNLNAHLETIKWLESFKKKKSRSTFEGDGALENIRGLFCSLRDYRWVSVSDSMDFISAIEKIYEHSNTPFPPQVIPQFKPPSQHALAVAIATDFLIHWQVNSPSSQFVIPHKNSAITL
ncbi:hypothetical protein BY996DRAFT_6426707 [Phakopsora pachyrhizi]|nr:hypothetical protein BY996DRAFT_6426707 [Phakopsora pachyrhizi]